MGNVLAAGPGSMPSPPSGVPPPPQAPGFMPSPPSPGSEPAAPDGPLNIPEDSGPGTFEDLHKKCKDLFPVPYEGAKILVNKGLSNHFQISHTITMSSLQPSGYKFGCTYVGTKQYSPMEAFPIFIGDIDPSGNLNANIIHQFTKNTRCKFAAQIQNNRWLAGQVTTDYKGTDYSASLTVANPDIINGSGVIVAQYLQNVTKHLVLGTELVYQRGPTVPGNQLAVYTLAGRYSGNNWQLSGNLTPIAGSMHLCYYHKVGENTQIGTEIEGSLRTQECTATLGYQIDLPVTNFTFRGQIDSNWCVGATLEKKLLPLPFTMSLSGFANHVKNTYRFGVALIIG